MVERKEEVLLCLLGSSKSGSVGRAGWRELFVALSSLLFDESQVVLTVAPVIVAFERNGEKDRSSHILVPFFARNYARFVSSHTAQNPLIIISSFIQPQSKEVKAPRAKSTQSTSIHTNLELAQVPGFCGFRSLLKHILSFGGYHIDNINSFQTSSGRQIISKNT